MTKAARKTTAKVSAGEVAALPFAQRRAWAAWLASHHASSPGVWLKLAKKSTGTASVTYPEALEVALAWGWIDAQKKGLNESWWLQKFMPRGARSIWSKINRQKALRLIERGEMKPPGLEAVLAAQRDGRWEAAYDSPSGATVPDDLQAELDRDSQARAFFASLNSQNRYAILFRIQTARKPETRLNRIQQFMEMLRRKEKLHP